MGVQESLVLGQKAHKYVGKCISFRVVVPYYRLASLLIQYVLKLRMARGGCSRSAISIGART